MTDQRTAEAFKPVPVRRGTGAFAEGVFAARTAVDLQLLTCVRFLAPRLARAEGRVLDVGCGEMPFRPLLPPTCRYTGIDIAAAGEFGMTAHPDVVAFDGRTIPFPDASFEVVLCTEVLEHADDPVGLLAEMRRVLVPGGTLLATVPFAARVHHAPHDHHRFTRYRLAALFADFEDVVVVERGDDLATIANKIIVLTARLVRRGPAGWPFALVAGAAAIPALGIAHLSLAFGWGSPDDPLGYGIAARKPD